MKSLERLVNKIMLLGLLITTFLLALGLPVMYELKLIHYLAWFLEPIAIGLCLKAITLYRRAKW
jgi:hypothetical protein